MHSCRDLEAQDCGSSLKFDPYDFSTLDPYKEPDAANTPREIQLYVKNLNTEQRFRRKWVKTGTAAESRHSARAHDLPSASWRQRGSAPVRLQVLYGNTAAPNVVPIPALQKHSAQLSQCIFTPRYSLSLTRAVTIVGGLNAGTC